ncbi:hypothetical protein D8674_024836 [Pyrus ussuriensis x Pyrus communis]|uniref:Uncharacterized protein n=1 Tax=Pyrus ussuriensis x Pyrus communis TaxID=2448454 RepID=A0A5N5HHI2_9ROSA|nr:hypothetical protein D8674_024836 [Pyrus ussuriensis x Pyrus communis]
MLEVKPNQAPTEKREVVILNQTPQRTDMSPPMVENQEGCQWKPLTIVPRQTHKWKVTVRTPELKLYAYSDKAVEYGETRWKQIKLKVKLRQAEPMWERKKRKTMDE